MVNISKDILSNKKQRDILNGQCSSWADVLFGAPNFPLMAYQIDFKVNVNYMQMILASSWL